MQCIPDEVFGQFIKYLCAWFIIFPNINIIHKKKSNLCAEHWIWPYGTGHMDNCSCLIGSINVLITFFNRAYDISEAFICFNLFNNFAVEIYFTHGGLPETHDFCFGFINSHMIIDIANVCNPSNCFCIPCWVSENSISSSNHNRWAIISSDITTPYSQLRYAPRSVMYLRNRNPLAIPPWLTPILFNIGGFSFALSFVVYLLLCFFISCLTIWRIECSGWWYQTPSRNRPSKPVMVYLVPFVSQSAHSTRFSYQKFGCHVKIHPCVYQYHGKPHSQK